MSDFLISYFASLVSGLSLVIFGLGVYKFIYSKKDIKKIKQQNEKGDNVFIGQASFLVVDPDESMKYGLTIRENKKGDQNDNN